MHLALFQTGLFDFFSVGTTWLWQNIVWATYLLHISSDKTLVRRVYDHTGCKEPCKDFSVALFS